MIMIFMARLEIKILRLFDNLYSHCDGNTPQCLVASLPTQGFISHY